MTKHRKISVEEILADTGHEGYLVDGLHLLARMIAQQCISDRMPAQGSTGSHTSRPDNFSEGKLENEGN
jgi:hypothetical protein